MFPIIEHVCFQKSYHPDHFWSGSFLSMPVSFATLGGHNMKSKINFLLPFSLNSRSFTTTSHALFATFLSPYPIICLSCSTGYYFTFSHSKVRLSYTAQKMKFSVKDFFSKFDQIRRKLRIWSHLLKKSLMENFIFCALLLLKTGMGDKVKPKQYVQIRFTNFINFAHTNNQSWV